MIFTLIFSLTVTLIPMFSVNINVYINVNALENVNVNFKVCINFNAFENVNMNFKVNRNVNINAISMRMSMTIA